MTSVFKKWFEVFFVPQRYCEEYKAEASIGRAVLNILIASAVGGLIFVIAVALIGSLMGSVSGIFGLTVGGIVGIAIGLFLLGGWIVSSILALLIGSAVLLLIAKIFGGKGDYTTQTYLISLYSSANILATSVLGWIPFLGLVIGLLANLWSFYPLTVSLQKTHNYSTGRAIGTWGILVVIPAILFLLVALL
jgi:hypothetical protein